MGFFSRRNQTDETETDETPSEDTTPPTSEPTQDEDTAPEQTRNASARMFDTALGAGSSLEGTLTSDGNVRLDGEFKGTLNIKESVLVGVTARIEADIAAKNVSVAGVVRGDVSGTKVHLLATAKIWGDISAESLITEDGAFIQGRVNMREAHEEEAPPILTEDDLAQPEDGEEAV